ncbi:MAG: hypothetical protein ACI4ST_03280, partial [Candidatus Gallimonas sp.]
MGFFSFRDCFARALVHRKTPIVFAVIFVLCFVLGIAFIGSPSVYDYHLNACERFLDRICFSSRSVFVIFLERTVGSALLLALFLLAGIHPVGLILPPALFVFRAYTCGGSVAIFFSVYGFTGIFVGLVLYFPVHLALDFLFLVASSLSCDRARKFRFCKEETCSLLADFVVLLIVVAAVCLI